ncbi:MAG: hypothetical protein Q8R30_02200 [bacterium]|nr:hypothetical protein [bacterium]
MKSEQYRDLAKATRAYAISCCAVLAQEDEAVSAQVSTDLESAYSAIVKVICKTHLQTPEYAELYLRSIRKNIRILCGVGMTELEYLQVPAVKDFLWKFNSNLCSRCGDVPRQHDSSLCGNCGYLYGVPPSPPVRVA